MDRSGRETRRPSPPRCCVRAGIGARRRAHAPLPLAPLIVKPAVAVIAFAANRPLSPRGERANVLAEALSQVGDVEMIAGVGDPPGRESASRRTRRLVGNLARTVLLDVH